MQLDICTNWNTQPVVGATGLTAAPVWELQTGPTDYLVLLAAWADFLPNVLASTALVFGLGVPAARGIAASDDATDRFTQQIFIAENNLLTDALPGTILLTSWRTPPTAPANFLRRATVNGANGGVGGGRYRHVNWTFPNGLRVGPNSSIVLWGIALSAVLPFPIDSAVVIED